MVGAVEGEEEVGEEGVEGGGDEGGEEEDLGVAGRGARVLVGSGRLEVGGGDAHTLTTSKKAIMGQPMLKPTPCLPLPLQCKSVGSVLAS